MYYKIAQHPLSFAQSTAYPLRPNNGDPVPYSSPYVIWTPYGGPNGTVVVSSGTSSNLYLNYQYGHGAWSVIQTVSPASYSRSIALSADTSVVFLAGAGPLEGKGSQNRLMLNTVRLKPSG